MQYITYDEDISQCQIPLRHIVWTGEDLIHLHKHGQVSANIRLYFAPLGQPGFHFCAVKFHSASAGFDNVWNDPEVSVEILCSGIAYFDGIRHLWMPYWHCVDPCDGVTLFQILSMLVKQYCPNA